MKRVLTLSPREADHALLCRRYGCVCSTCLLVRLKLADPRPLRIVVTERV